MKTFVAVLLTFACGALLANPPESVQLAVSGATAERMENGCWKVTCPPGSEQVNLMFTGLCGGADVEALAFDFYAEDLSRFSGFMQRVFDADMKGFLRFSASPFHRREWSVLRVEKAKGTSACGGCADWARLGGVKFTVEVVSPEGGVFFLGAPRPIRPPRLAPGRPGERRLGWCTAMALGGRRNWDETAAFLKRHGFTDMVVLASRGACAYFASRNLPQPDGWDVGYDNVKQGLSAARRHGLLFHAWKTCWQVRVDTPKSFKARLAAENRYQVAADGKVDTGWLCPSDPQNRALEIAVMKEFVDLGADAIHFDYMRYAGTDHCFCARCLKGFSEREGRAIANAAAVRADAALLKRWNAYRAELLSSVVRECADYAHANGRKVSAAVRRDPPRDLKVAAQDWVRWCREGWLDVVCPMDYYWSPDVYRGFLERQRDCLKGTKTEFCPGLGVSYNGCPAMPVPNLIEELNILREMGFGGFTVFSIDSHAEKVFPSLFGVVP